MPNSIAAQLPDADRASQPLHLRFTAGEGAVEGVLALTQEWAREHGIARDDGLSLRLVLDELLSNICMYAPPDTRVELHVELHANAPALAGEKSLSVVRITLMDTGPVFDPLSHCPAPHSSVLRDSVPGGQGLTLVRLLTAAGQWQRMDGANQLSLELPLEGSEQQHRQSASLSNGQGISCMARLRALWSEHLALRQTVLFSFCAMLCIWSSMGLYYAAAQTQRQNSAKVLVFQAMNTQAVISTSFMQRVLLGLENLARSLPLPPEGKTAVDPDILLRQLWHGATVRPLTAEIPVLGVAAGQNGRTWLYRLEGGGVQRQEMEQDWGKLVSPPGTAPLWRSLFVTLQENDPHAAMIYALPLTSSQQVQDGWIGVVITMPWIANTLKKLGGFERSVPFFCDGDGRYIIFPVGRQLGAGPQSLGQERHAAQTLASLEQRMLTGEKTLIQLRSVFGDDATPWPLPWQGPTSLAFVPLGIQGWHLGLLVSSKELGDAPLPLPAAFIVAAVFGPLFMGCLTWMVTSRTLNPLHRLADALERLSRGDMNTPIPAPRQADEIGVMLHTFERVRVTLKQSLHNLAYSTTAHQRLSNELALVRRIQQSMLPSTFPCWSGAQGHATVLMAQEVCGDLYDYFVTSEGKLCLIMGDVCGKGAPAAIIMSRAITLARAFVLQGCSPAQTLEKLNTALLRHDTAHMFVTLLVGLLEEDGRFTWAAAGHPPPLLGPEPQASAAGNATALPWSNELVLGVRQHQRYTNHALRLQPGQSLLLYTDGLEEALSPECTDYSGQLLPSFTTVCKEGGSPEQKLTALLADHARHRGDTALADDISCLLVTRT